ncbi:GreA/GreB family elongation factor [Flavobacterium sp.]|uniref:GreA/GreB family elongation factor n=1 Tax=Flavobacterium sp. TaxID=239 RepID=UPI0028BEBBC4|nr:GreA/GreB family elongation factor [Flavobacterium sp.]
MTFKQKILQHHMVLLQDKIDVYRDMISGLADDAQNDAKSSAGDKHETALSMMHLEQEKLSAKLQEAIHFKEILSKIDVSMDSDKVILGSLVKANNLQLFISAALPKITIDGISVLALSPQSPLGSQLIGKEVGDEVEVNGSKFTVEAVQ